MLIAVTGTHGFIGKAFVRLCQAQGHTLIPIERTTQGFAWHDADGCDALVHLAGRNIASRWSAAFKATMLREREAALLGLNAALAQMNTPPKTVLVASAIGHYGETYTPADESAPRGNGFAAEICAVTEGTLQVPPSCRVVYARIGVVMHAEGGALAKMLPAFKLGLGGRMGIGMQILSWISRHDVCRALLHCLEHKVIQGPINLVAPAPCPQADFAKTLGRVLRRPAFFPMPAFMVKLLFGQMGQELLLQSCAVSSRTLEQSGFTFAHPTLQAALIAALNSD
jgi:uncharacterized protein (TIGR01777 family)